MRSATAQAPPAAKATPARVPARSRVPPAGTLGGTLGPRRLPARRQPRHRHRLPRRLRQPPRQHLRPRRHRAPPPSARPPSSAPARVGAGQPRQVAVDSRGIVYASDSQNGGELDRYDSLNANGGGVGFLASIPSSVNEVQEFSFSTSKRERRHISPHLPQRRADRRHRIRRRHRHRSTTTPSTAACGAANVVVVQGGPPTGTRVVFVGALGARDVPEMTCTVVSAASALASCSVTTLTEGRASTLLPGASTLRQHRLRHHRPRRRPRLRRRRPRRRRPLRPARQRHPQRDPAARPRKRPRPHRRAQRRRRRARQGRGLPQHSRPWLKRRERPALRLDSTCSATFGAPGGGALGGGHRVYVLDDPLPDPTVALDPVTIKDDTTATFSATVDPTGGLLRCEFQYSTDPGFSSFTELSAKGCPSLDPDGGPQPLSQKITGLIPNTHYFVRLRTTRAFDTSAVFTSASIEFDTDSVPPVISDIGAIGVNDTSATLVGTIDPRNSATGSYFFSYGTTPAADEQTTASVDIGGGTRLDHRLSADIGPGQRHRLLLPPHRDQRVRLDPKPRGGLPHPRGPLPAPAGQLPQRRHPRSPGLDLPR